MKRQGKLALVVAITATVVACAAPASDQLMTTCSGSFACAKNGDYLARDGVVLTPQGDDCSTGSYLLHPDGTVTNAPSVSAGSGTWSATSWTDDYKQFDFTIGSDSYSCHSQQLVTCVRTFQVTTDCDYNPPPADTSCFENIVPENCSSSSWTDSGAYCDTLNDDSETAFTNGETCASLGY